MRTHATLTHAIENVRSMHAHDIEEQQSRTAALQRLGSLRVLLGGLLDAIDSDDTTACYDELDTILTAIRISQGKIQPHAAD